MKKIIISSLLSLIALLFIAPISMAQTASPVKWSYQIKENADKVSTIYVKATIDKGFHIFTNEPGDTDGFLVPTTIGVKFMGPDGATITMPITDRMANTKPIQANMEGIGNVNYYEGDVVYSMPFARTTHTIGGSILISYQCCDHKMCLPPTELELKIK